mmetsp:Transcript_43136/g.106521  ORF Transcript_43136/g.106521 Transcript_43136/m.106521 type:complete len:251 (+) Transcript_43136:102-854(+)
MRFHRDGLRPGQGRHGLRQLRHGDRGEHHRVRGAVRRGRQRRLLGGRPVYQRERHGDDELVLRQGEPRDHHLQRPAQDLAHRGRALAQLAPRGGGAALLPARRAAQLHPGPAHAARGCGVPVHCLPAREDAAHAHRLLRRAADQRVRTRQHLPQVHAVAQPAAPAHRPEPLHPPLRLAARAGRQDARRLDAGAAPGAAHEARLDSDGAPTVGHLRRGAACRRARARLSAHAARAGTRGAHLRRDAAQAAV